MMIEPSRLALGLLCGVIAVALGGAALLEMGAGLANALADVSVEGPSEFLLGLMFLPFASFALWGAWRMFH
jgi:hypothetical protein